MTVSGPNFASPVGAAKLESLPGPATKGLDENAEPLLEVRLPKPDEAREPKPPTEGAVAKDPREGPKALDFSLSLP